MPVKKVLIFILSLHFSYAATAQFYIGCDSLVWTKTGGYHMSPNTTIRNIELYQDSALNKLLLVSNLKGRKILHPISYKVLDDSETGQPFVLLTRGETVNLKLVQKQQLTGLTKYRNFIKVTPLDNSDSDYVATAEGTNDGIDELNTMWRVKDCDIPCELFVYFTSNNPRHSPVYYYDLSFGLPCINVNTVSKCKKCPVE